MTKPSEISSCRVPWSWFLLKKRDISDLRFRDFRSSLPLLNAQASEEILHMRVAGFEMASNGGHSKDVDFDVQIFFI